MQTGTRRYEGCELMLLGSEACQELLYCCQGCPQDDQCSVWPVPPPMGDGKEERLHNAYRIL